MDHSEAVRLHAAEKYVLGELAPTLRDEYEEHFFDCQECAADLRIAVAFVDTSRSVFRSLPQEGSRERQSFFDAFSSRFFRPAWTVPAMALLLFALAYQTFVYRGFVGMPRRTTAPIALGSANFISLIGANSRAEAAKSFSVSTGKPLILEVDIPTSGDYAAYQCQLRDPSGHIVLDSAVTSIEAKNTVHLIVPTGQLESGAYSLSVSGRRSAPASAETEVMQIKFTIEVTR